MNGKFLRISLLSSILVILVLSSFSSIQTVEAYTYTDLNIPTDVVFEPNPRNSYIVHTSGKIVYMHGAIANATLRIYILSSSGVLESYIKEDLIGIGGIKVRAIALTNSDSVNVTAFIAMADSPSSQMVFLWINVNINTYVVTLSNVVVKTVGTTEATYSECRPSRVFKYNGDFFVSFIAGNLDYADAESYLGLAKLSGNTNTIHDGIVKGLTPEYYSWTYGVQDTDFGGQFLYIVYGRDGYDSVHYGKWDLEDEGLTVYANQPISTGRMILEHPQQLIGAGIVDEWDNGGSNNYTWLYYTWAWMVYDTGVDYVYIVHTKLCFNDTDENIDTGELLGLTETIVAVTTNHGAGLSGLSGGFHINGVYDNFYVIYSDLETGILTTRITEWEMDGDWFNLGVSGMTKVDDFANPNYSPYYLYNEIVGRNFSVPVQVNMYEVAGRLRVTYGLTVFEAIYDITLDFTPNDEPFYSDTLYGIDGVTYRNGLGTSLVTFLYKDDVLTNSLVSNANGEFTLTSWMFVGVSSWEFRLYSSGESVYNETFNFLSVYREGAEEGEIEPSMILPTTLELLFMGIAPLVMSLAPAVILGQSMGLVGIVVGLGIGIGISSVTGILPSYFLYLDILFIAIIFVYFLRGR